MEDLLAEYMEARRLDGIARLRRTLALRAMLANGWSQRQIAESLGISQPAVSQQLTSSPDLSGVHPETLLEAATPVLKTLAHEHGFRRLAAFGSVARHAARDDSDIDLLVESPDGTSTFDFVVFKQLLEEVLGRQIDLVDYSGLNPRRDRDILADAVPL